MVLNIFWIFPNPIQRTLQRFTTPGTIEREAIEQFNQKIQGLQDFDTLSAKIPQALETYLELSFVALWLAYEETIFSLEFYTDQAPQDKLPDTLSPSEVWEPGPTRLTAGILAEAGCEIMLPLSAGDRHIGILGLGKRWTEEVFDDTDLITLEVIAHQAALALSTAYQIRALRLFPLRVEEAQRQERNAIAQNLHDSTQAQLNQLNFALDFATLITLRLTNPSMRVTIRPYRYIGCFLEEVYMRKRIHSALGYMTPAGNVC